MVTGLWWDVRKEGPKIVGCGIFQILLVFFVLMNNYRLNIIKGGLRSIVHQMVIEAYQQYIR